MPKKRLTTATIDSIPVPVTGQVEYFDTLLPSFGLRVSYSGTKAWFAMTRVDGKLIRLTLGRHPSMKLSDARKRAREALQCAAEGVDPRHVEEERRLKRKIDIENTFGRLVEDFMDKHVLPNLRQSTQREYRRILLGEDTQGWRSRPIASIKKRDILDLMDRIDRRGTKTASALAIAYLRKFFNWCTDREVIEASPIDRIRSGRKLQSRERVLNAEELRVVWAAFDAEPFLFGPLCKLLLLTGQRRGEVSGMRWDELRNLETEHPIWEIPGERTKNHRPHIVPVSPQVAQIIHALPKNGPYVFSTTGTTPVSGFSKAKARIDCQIEDIQRANGEPSIQPWTLHDLRRTMVTSLNEHIRTAPHVVEAIVNHITGPAKGGIAGIYNRALYLDERRAALCDWGQYVSRVTGREDVKDRARTKTE